jgi:hypothetical protein
VNTGILLAQLTWSAPRKHSKDRRRREEKVKRDKDKDKGKWSSSSLEAFIRSSTGSS